MRRCFVSWIGDGRPYAGDKDDLEGTRSPSPSWLLVSSWAVVRVVKRPGFLVEPSANWIRGREGEVGAHVRCRRSLCILRAVGGGELTLDSSEKEMPRASTTQEE